MYIKIKDGNPSIKSTRKMRAQVNTTQKIKMKANNQKKVKKTFYENRTYGYEMTINDNKDDLKQKKMSFVTNLLVTKGALAIMCGRAEEPQPSGAAH